MTASRTARHTTKLIQLKEKMAALRQEEEKICQTLAQDLAQCLINAQALEIDFDTLIGGVLEVVNQAQIATPKVEAWKKSGQKFRRRVNDPWGQNERNKGSEKQARQEGQQGNKQASHQPEQPAHPHPSPVVPKTEKVTEKAIQAEGKNKPHTHFSITGNNYDENKKS